MDVGLELNHPMLYEVRGRYITVSDIVIKIIKREIAAGPK